MKKVKLKKVIKLVNHYKPILGLDAWDIYVGVHPFEEVEAWGRAEVRVPYQRAVISIADSVSPESLRYVVLHEMCHIVAGYQSHVAHGLVDSLSSERRDREGKLVSDADETVTELLARAILRMEGHR